MIAVHPRTAKHLVLSRLAAAPAPLSVLLQRVRARQEAAGAPVKMSAELLRRHLKTLAKHGYAKEAEDDAFSLTPLGELTLIGLGEWQPRYRPLEASA
ncbi:hypothetical protein WDJ50_18540 (plasmid) [Deinococcus sp. VB142]|uniref:Transcriptional regulator n=1 Tax=Deinococcus sp. VB142 TaxID=3112952 RepID=A0AAU6Q9C1_9DEIO